MKSVKRYIDPFVYNSRSDRAELRGGLNAINKHLSEKARYIIWWQHIDYPSSRIKNQLMFDLKEAVNNEIS